MNMAHTPPGKTRKQVFRYVRDRLLAGSSPTIREVQEAFGFSAVESARKHLEALVADGLLKKESGKSRGYRLASGANPAFPPALIPLVGQVQAGAFAEAIENPEGFLPVSSPASRSARLSRVGRDELFALRVRGQSMIEAGIFPGDFVVVRRQPVAQNGEIVVAQVDGEATVKTFRIRNRRIELHPANPEFDIIVPDPSELTILGKVVEVHRYFEYEPVVEAP
jgi:repressor LexA